jgi:serine/threonine protein kinase
VAETVQSASKETDLKRLNGYRIGRALGAGSYGTVYEVHRPPGSRRAWHAPQARTDAHVPPLACRVPELMGSGWPSRSSPAR